MVPIRGTGQNTSLPVWQCLDYTQVITSTNGCQINSLRTNVGGLHYGLAAILGYLALLPIKTLPDVATFVLVACGVFALVSRARLRPGLQRADHVVIYVLFTACALSAVLSTDPGRGVRFLVYLSLNLFLLVLVTAMDSKGPKRAIAWCLAVVGIFHLGALILVQLLVSPGTPEALIETLGLATLIVPNDALILGLCLPALAMVLSPAAGEGQGRGRVARVVLPGYFALSVYASYLLRSKLTLLCLLSALLAVAAARFGSRHAGSIRQRRWVLVSGVAVVLLLLSFSTWYFGNQSTTRLTLWDAAVTHHSTPVEFLFGAGPNTFVHDPRLSVSRFDSGDLVVPWVHNAYLEAYYDQGLVGLGGFLALTVLPILRSARIADPDFRTFLLGSLVAFCIAAWFEITLTRRFYFAYIVIMYGLACAQTRSGSE